MHAAVSSLQVSVVLVVRPQVVLEHQMGLYADFRMKLRGIAESAVPVKDVAIAARAIGVPVHWICLLRNV